MAKRKTLVYNFEELVESGDVEEIKKVFTKCDINAYGGYNKGNALEFLLSDEMMEWLVEQGADINYVDDYGYTPLLYHAGHSFAEKQAICLLRLGADIHYTYKLYQKNALHYAVSAGSLELVKCLMEAGVDVNAQDANGDTPLESGFSAARTFDLIALEPVTKYMLSQGISVTEKIREKMMKVAEDIEFRRKDLNPDEVPKLDAAMDSLYQLLHMESVPERVEYDGKTIIIVKETTWQKQHGELWDLLVPGSGHANTVQGEVIRISGKVAYEILDNGGMNWDKDYSKMCQSFLKYLKMGNTLQKQEYKELKKIIKSIRSVDEEEINRMTELGVNWVVLNPEPISLEKVDYKR